jgi:hypothetical protein
MSRSKKTILLGGDPEVFIRNITHEHMVSSCDVIGGDKGKGIPIPSLKDSPRSFKWLEDNVSVELNFDPYTNASDFVTGIAQMYAGVRHSLRQLWNEWDVAVVPSAIFRNVDLQSRKAKTIGCDPDFCAYQYPNTLRPPFSIDMFGNWRYAGGHLHLGFQNTDKIPAFAMAMLCDVYLGLPSIAVDKQENRRSMYGLAGLYREKSYGIEYRTMSNWWMEHNLAHPNYQTIDRFRKIVTINAFKLMYAFQHTPLELSNMFSTLPFKDIQECIDKENTAAMPELYREIRQMAANHNLELCVLPEANTYPKDKYVMHLGSTDEQTPF